MNLVLALLAIFTLTTTFLAVVVIKAPYTGHTATVFGNFFSSGTSWAFNAAICCWVVKLVIVTVMMLCLQKKNKKKTGNALWVSRPLPRMSLETLSEDDDDGSENVVQKMNLCSFKLNRVYLDPLNISNAGDFSWN